MLKLNIVIKREFLQKFFSLLQQGFVVTTEAGCSIEDFLCKQIGIGRGYLQDRIQTLFLDGMPVDDVSQAYLRNNATLALSGAMPGLVGATFRRGGALASMRNTISYGSVQPAKEEGAARVNIKLFNLILKELGTTFLENGVLIGCDKLQAFLSQNADDLKTACVSVVLNDQKLNVAALAQTNWDNPELFLKVTAKAS